MVTITAAMNGKVPDALLAPVPFQTSLRLASDAAASLGRLNAAVRAAHSWSLSLTSAYRTVAEQNTLKAQGLTTVSGGASEHGLARAADIGGLGGQTGTRYAQLAALAGAHGWYQPAWALHGIWKNGKQVQAPEPWHWEHDPARDTHPTTSEEDDMPYTEAQLEQIARQGADLAITALIADGRLGAMVKAATAEQLTLLREQQKRNVSVVVPAVVDALLTAEVPEHANLTGDARQVQYLLRDTRIQTRAIQTAIEKG